MSSATTPLIKRIVFPKTVVFLEATLFCLILGLGIVTGMRIQPIYQQIQGPQAVSISRIPIWQFVAYFALFTLFIFAISSITKFKKARAPVFKTIFVLAVGWGAFVCFGAWMRAFLVFPIIILLVVWWLWKPSVLLHDINMILGIAGTSSILGLQFEPLTLVILLIIFSVYDFVAVYKTRHMVKMAREMVKSKAILGLIIPQRISDFGRHLNQVKPGGKFLILGGGDVAFPLLLCVSLLPRGIFSSLFVAGFALMGLLFSFWVFASQESRQPIPALPPITLFCLLGYLLVSTIL